MIGRKIVGAVHSDGSIAVTFPEAGEWEGPIYELRHGQWVVIPLFWRVR